MSRSNPKPGAYHHGDLRAALIAAGLRALEAVGSADLSLRQIARDTGVSATAVYHHFPDKRALLGALAASGFDRLGEHQLQAAAGAASQAEGFAAIGRAYVRFALAHPHLFRLMFSQGSGGGVQRQGKAAELLQANAAALASGNTAAEERIALQAWAVVHGLAMLMLDGQLPADDALIDALIDSGSLFQG